MNILVIGGSYFFGRWFVQFAHQKHNITVVNRGSIPVGLSGVTEVVADRHNERELKSLFADADYDCIVDFCAYVPRDIKTIADLIGQENTRYLFVSTIDVYERGSNCILTENSPLESRIFPGDIGEYIHNKVLLEKELEDCCKGKMEFCSVRPSLLYGPANYAPRERIYFDWISQHGKIYNPTDASGYFWPLYIKDAALMTLALCEAEVVAPAVNLCPDTPEDYTSWNRTLHSICCEEFTEIPITVQKVLEEGVQLPFPLTAEESEKYNNTLSKELGIPYTDIKTGLKKTYELYKKQAR